MREWRAGPLPAKQQKNQTKISLRTCQPTPFTSSPHTRALQQYHLLKSIMLQPRTARALQVFTLTTMSATTFHLVFRQEYEDPRAGAIKNKEHIFSNCQRWYRNMVDTTIGLEPIHQQQTKN